MLSELVADVEGAPASAASSSSSQRANRRVRHIRPQPSDAVDSEATTPYKGHVNDHFLDPKTGLPATSRVLQDAIYGECLLEGTEEASTVQLPFLAPDGTPLFERADVNKERGMNLTTLEDYTNSIKKSGPMKGIGGQIWAVPNQVMNPTKYYLITAGTRFTAI